MDTTSIIISVTTIVLSAIVLAIAYFIVRCLNDEVDKTNR